MLLTVIGVLSWFVVGNFYNILLCFCEICVFCKSASGI
jgi:hypothetical protein